jgi:subtilisin family serine protease/PKD repeat protein
MNKHLAFFNLFVISALLLSAWLSPMPIQLTLAADEPASAIGQGDPLSKVESLVLTEIAANGKTDFFVWMKEKADLSPAYQLQSKEARGRFVFETLRATAERTQQDLRAYLDQQGARYEPFYIANKLLVRDGNQTFLLTLASRPDVARITANYQFQLDQPFVNPNSPPHITAVEPNLTFINADDVWTLGYTGQGTVLAGNDTGLDETHPAIARHYRGCLNPPACTSWDHNYNWWDATNTYPSNPFDGYGHGTHTTGTMVGDDGGANQIGVAPDAQTIHCKNMTDYGGGSDATFTTCFQWDLAPWDLSGDNPDPSKAPDAINNSWGYGGGNAPQFEDEIAALQAAGILVEASAGNSGPYCATLGSPGDYRQVLTTGSVNHSGGALPGTLTGFSSRGPSDLYPTPPSYFPDIMAPGENVRSSLPGNSYAYWSGTSMAGPHATALIGLMWSANPGLRGMVTQTIQIIQDTAAPLTGQSGSNCGGDYTQGPNNDWGYGTLDALAAVQAALLYGGVGKLAGNVTDSSSGQPIANASVDASLTPTMVWHGKTNAKGDYALTVFSGTYTVTARTYAYYTKTITDIRVTEGNTTTLDIQLDPTPTYIVSGTVQDATTGWPLYARININGYPYSPIWNDPVSGFYSITLAADIAYTFDVSAWVSGYATTNRIVGPLTSDSTEQFDLTANGTTCNAPGYARVYNYVYSENFESGYSNWTMTGLWNPENEADTCGFKVAPFPNPRNDAYFGLDATCTYDTGRVVTGTLAMNTPIALPAADSANLYFWSYEQTECTGNCYWDNRYVEISTDGGGSWKTVGEGNIENAWYQKTFNLLPYADNNILLRFRFDSVDSIANNYLGWMVDNLSIRVGNCVPTSGGLVVGNVYAANTGAPLTGARVVNDSGRAFAAMTTVDPAVPDSFYTLFSPDGLRVFTATMSGGYAPGVTTTNVVQSSTVRQDFSLLAGWLSFVPPSLEITLDMGISGTLPFTLNNNGTRAATFELRERNLGFRSAALGRGRGEWLYRSETGEPMQTNKGDTALVYPSAYHWQPEGGPTAFNILIYADDWIHRPPNTFLDQALQNLGLAYTAHYDADWAGFEADLNSNTWSLVLFGNDSWRPPASMWTALNNYVNGGGKLVLHAWTISSAPGNPLWTTLGVTFVSDDMDPPDPVYWWQPDHPLFTSPNNVPEFTSLNGGIYGIYGQHVEPSPGFQALAGYTALAPDPNQAAIVLGNDDRTLFKGFLDGQNSANLDGDTLLDSVELWINLIDGIRVGFAADVPWLNESPISGTIAAHSDQAIGVTFNAAAPEITEPGQYYAQLRIKEDTPYTPAEVPVTMTVTLPSTYGKLDGIVTGLGHCDTNPAPLKDATVLIEGSTGLTRTLTTNISGTYAIWLDQANSPLTITVTADDHQMGQATGVMLAGQTTTTVNFDVRWLRPCAAVTPPDLSAAHTWGLSTTLPMTITNSGATALTYQLFEYSRGSQVLGHAPSSFPMLESQLTGQQPEDKIEPALRQQLDVRSPTEFFVHLRQQADLSATHAQPAKAAKGQYTFQALRWVADHTQQDLRKLLDKRGIKYRPFFIANKVLVTGDLSLALDLAARSDVARITANHEYQLPKPFAQPESGRVAAVEWNIAQIRANAVWDTFGVTGQGVVVADADTGAAWTHPALQSHYRGWNGATADHNYNWHDATNTYPTVPNDGNGHGSHTAGTMVGDDGGSNQIGVAPGSKWIACKNMTDYGDGSDATFTDCFQWLLAPTDLNNANPDPTRAPDVINNSWGYWDGNAPQFRDEIANLQSAGILVEVSAGNEGPYCATLRSPGDYFEVLTTGSTWGALDSLSGFSSRGPSDLDGNYFPDIVAPGENIRSSVPGGGYSSWGGTSMAGPHAVGLVALMWSANPGLRGQIDMTTRIITETAVRLVGQNGSNCGGDHVAGPNNDWGYGRIDAYAAVDMALNMDVPWLSEEPITGTVAAGSNAVVSVTLDAGAVSQPGTHWATLRVRSDDPVHPLINAPTTMTVSSLAGWGKLMGAVTGLGHCDAPGAPLDKATVFVQSGTGLTWTLTTNVSGTYALWMDKANSPLTVTASHSGYLTGTAMGAIVTAQNTTTQDFSLRLDAPCLTANPNSMAVTLTSGLSVTLPLTLTNTGAGTTTFQLQEANQGVASRIARIAPSVASANYTGPHSGIKEGVPTVPPRPATASVGSGCVVAVAADNYGGSETNELHNTLTQFGYSWVDVYTVQEARDAGAATLIVRYTGWSLPIADLNNWLTEGHGLIQFGDWVDWFPNEWEAQPSGTPLSITVADSGYPLAQGLPSSWAGLGFFAYNWDSDALGWVTDVSYPNIIQAQYGALRERAATATGYGLGRAVYIGFNVYGYLAGNNDKRLFDNAITWTGRCGQDVPWLRENPISGTVSADSALSVNLTFTALPTMTSGVYTAALVIRTSDTFQPKINVPVTMTFLAPPTCGFASSGPDDVGQVTTFTNMTQGVGPLSYSWDLGDGSFDSATHPTHAYTYGDLFTVVLTATNPWGQDVCSRTVSIEGPPLARFSSDSPVVPGRPAIFVNTTRANPPVSTWVWDLGDGTISTDQTPPPHLYANTQNYIVALIAINSKGIGVYTDTVTVRAYRVFLPLVQKQ